MNKICGRVFKGQGLGKKIGFPTLNVSYSGEISGVFAGEVLLNGKIYGAAVNVGGRPTVDNEKLCEAFLLNFDREIAAGTEVEIRLIEKIRDVEKFADLESLVKQISLDVEFVKNWYNSAR